MPVATMEAEQTNDTETADAASESPPEIRLEWKEVNDGATHEAISQIMDEVHNPFIWRIDYVATEQYSIAETKKTLRGEAEYVFPALEDAMVWCQERETALLLAEHTPIPDDYDVKDALKHPADEPPVEHKPFDIVQGVESYIAKALEDANNEEETITAKVLRQRNNVARLSIAMLRMDQGKKTIKERYEEAVELLDSMEKDAAHEVRQAEEKKIQPELPFGEKQPGDSTTSQPTDAPDPRLSIRLDTLKIKPALLAKLAENKPPLITVGDVADWSNQKSTAHGGNNELTDVTGVGAAKAAEIQAALDEVWFTQAVAK